MLTDLHTNQLYYEKFLYFVFIGLFLFSDFIAFSQSPVRIKGFVVNEAKEPVEGVYIEFLKDSCTVLTTAISGTKGEFEIKLPQVGYYLIGASHLAYEKYFRPTEVTSPFTILLKNSSVPLDEVVVRSDLKKNDDLQRRQPDFRPFRRG